RVDLAHPPGADEREDVVGAKAGASCQSHRCAVLGLYAREDGRRSRGRKALARHPTSALASERESERAADLAHASVAKLRDTTPDVIFGNGLNVVEIDGARLL